MAEGKNTMEIKKVSTTATHIENAYIKTVSSTDSEVLAQLFYAMNKRHSAIWNAIQNKTQLVYANIGKNTDFVDLKELIKQQFVINILHKITNIVADSLDSDANVQLCDIDVCKTLIRDDSLMTGYAATSANQVQKVLFSDLGKLQKTKTEGTFIERSSESVEATIEDDVQRAMLHDILSQLFTRKDQRTFVETVLLLGSRKAMMVLDLELKNFNRKIERALNTISKYTSAHPEEIEHIKAILNELVMNKIIDYEDELTSDDDISDIYTLETKKPLFIF